jgi:hypothetical protein
MTQQEQTYTLVFTVPQLNTVIAGLDELPHKYSRPLIDVIQQQLNAAAQAKAPEGPLSDKVVD